MSEDPGAGRASDFVRGRGGDPGGRRGKVGRTLRGGSPPKQDAGAGGRATSPRSIRAKPVRITVDLDPSLHRFLKTYSVEAGAKGAAVVRALLEELREAPELSDRVRDRMEDA
ncbi:MAG: hypothetical protein M3Q60_03470 [Actinomycetota bacterium]|nr:hypothetical protein [Actinomycetota bacterium]